MTRRPHLGWGLVVSEPPALRKPIIGLHRRNSLVGLLVQLSKLRFGAAIIGIVVELGMGFLDVSLHRVPAVPCRITILANHGPVPKLRNLLSRTRMVATRRNVHFSERHVWLRFLWPRWSRLAVASRLIHLLIVLEHLSNVRLDLRLILLSMLLDQLRLTTCWGVTLFISEPAAWMIAVCIWKHSLEVGTTASRLIHLLPVFVDTSNVILDLLIGMLNLTMITFFEILLLQRLDTLGLAVCSPKSRLIGCTRMLAVEIRKRGVLERWWRWRGSFTLGVARCPVAELRLFDLHRTVWHAVPLAILVDWLEANWLVDNNNIKDDRENTYHDSHHSTRKGTAEIVTRRIIRDWPRSGPRRSGSRRVTTGTVWRRDYFRGSGGLSRDCS